MIILTNLKERNLHEMNNDDLLKNKNANNKIDALYKIWLGVCSGNITFTEESDVDVKEARVLLRGGDNPTERRPLP